MSHKPTSPSIDAAMGGAAMAIYGRVNSSRPFADSDTGEAKHMVELTWWGGSKYFVCSPGEPISKLKEGDMVEIHQSYTFGKSGARPNGDPVIVNTPKVGAA